MNPSVARALWLICLLTLLRFDPARVKGMSLALWIPLIHIFIIGSRLPSTWIGGQGIAAQALEEGNDLDRSIYIALILLAIVVLMMRSFKWSELLWRNLALTAFLSFALLSVVWSDYPFVAFKRWFRDVGQYLTLLVALSDRDPLEAMRTVFRRACYVLIPLCILLNKYYPEMGKQYDMWSGKAYFVGATTSKNMLGLLCLFSGLFFIWDSLARWSDRKDRRTKQILLVNAVFIGMTVWLLSLADSATARVCLALGTMVLIAAHSRTIDRRPALLTWSLPIGFFVYQFLAFGLGLDLNALLASAVGRDPTLTGRTHIWDVLLAMQTNPVVGTGYESFWLGPRLRWVWEQAGGINEAHNGYLQIYLNLGFVGLFLLCAFLLASYWTACKRFRAHASLGSLGMAAWAVMLFYNNTEAAFPTGLLWLMLLPAGIMLSQLPLATVAEKRLPDASPRPPAWRPARPANAGSATR
jgi:exopolysaccharide production protein ExoQ